MEENIVWDYLNGKTDITKEELNKIIEKRGKLYEIISCDYTLDSLLSRIEFLVKIISSNEEKLYLFSFTSKNNSKSLTLNNMNLLCIDFSNLLKKNLSY